MALLYFKIFSFFLTSMSGMFFGLLFHLIMIDIVVIGTEAIIIAIWTDCI